MWRGDLTDAQWARLEPLLPTGKKPGRPPVWTRRQPIDGVRWRTRTGAPWRNVPERYGPWGRVYDLFRRWQRNGTWKRILAELQAQADTKCLITWDINVDCTVCRAHQHAAGARERGTCRRSPPGGVAGEPADHRLGRSRGGLATKLHLAVEQSQKPMSIVITAGQRGESPQFEVVLGCIRVARLGSGRPRVRPRRVRPTKRTPPARTAPICVGVASGAQSQTRRSMLRILHSSRSSVARSTTFPGSKLRAEPPL
ncbi:IS5 family transposase [Streptomyces nigrescens]|uniref:IS5 family transposase n=1 Tax=Streptomyces nigrescens TaxID=1920 RepID=A0ABY7IVU4_STRNI|nr:MULTISPECIES: IS5 family transposase [Streptomyces]MCX5450777.1 IS5 family transposase [Streptomyces libani]WAU02137.1 IS5 family transposase [Streptomyces nigrescens]